MKKQLRRNKGYITLISVIIFGVLGLAVAVSLLLLGLGASKSSLAIEQSAQAKGAADACAEAGLQAIRSDSNYSGSANLTLGAASCAFTVTKGADENRIVSASGASGTIIRKVKVTLDKISPQLNLTSWQEVADL